MLQTSSYLRIVRASAWYDIVSTIGFATPWTFGLTLAGLNALSGMLGITAQFPVFMPEQTLMANLLGSLVMVWSVLRLRDTRVLYGRYDVIARILFTIWQLNALAQGGHPIIWGFVVMEVVFGIAQALPIRDAATLPQPEADLNVHRH